MNFDGVTIVDEAYPVNSTSTQALQGYTPSGITLDHTLAIIGALQVGYKTSWYVPVACTISALHFGVGIAIPTNSFTVTVQNNGTTIYTATFNSGVQLLDVLGTALTSATLAANDLLAFTVSTVNNAVPGYHFSVQIDYKV